MLERDDDGAVFLPILLKIIIDTRNNFQLRYEAKRQRDGEID